MQVSGLTTIELNVNMHCEACAEQLKKKILKMKGRINNRNTQIVLLIKQPTSHWQWKFFYYKIHPKTINLKQDLLHIYICRGYNGGDWTELR